MVVHGPARDKEEIRFLKDGARRQRNFKKSHRFVTKRLKLNSSIQRMETDCESNQNDNYPSNNVLTIHYATLY